MQFEMACIKILRKYSDSSDDIYEEYSIPFEENKNVLQVLIEIFQNSDRSLAFRRNRCNRGMCGSCTMIINGKTARACVTKMTKEMVIEPVKKNGVIKDLAANIHNDSF